MDLSITNVRLDLGAGRRGTDMGPSAMHVAGLVGAVEQLGHEAVSIRDLGALGFEGTDVGDGAVRFLDQITKVCAELAALVGNAVEAGLFPLVLGGDHSIAIGSIGGLSRHYRSAGKRLGVLWVDAHLDMNTPETSPSGNIHGMPLAVLLGRGHPDLVGIIGSQPALDASDVAIFGARDVDGEEISIAADLGVRVFTMSEIDRRGTHQCLEEAIEIVTSDTDGVHLSFDLDGIDPSFAPGVGTAVPGGLTLRESHLLCEMVSQTQKLVSMEVAELNPTLDHQNKTAELAVWLIESALGRTILK